MSEIKLSEIKARNLAAIECLRKGKGKIDFKTALAISENLQYDIPHLLELVERLGKITDGLVFRYHRDHYGDLEDCHFHKCREGHALLKELEL